MLANIWDIKFVNESIIIVITNFSLFYSISLTRVARGSASALRFRTPHVAWSRRPRATAEDRDLALSSSLVARCYWNLTATGICYSNINDVIRCSNHYQYTGIIYLAFSRNNSFLGTVNTRCAVINNTPFVIDKI